MGTVKKESFRNCMGIVTAPDTVRQHKMPENAMGTVKKNHSDACRQPVSGICVFCRKERTENAALA